MADFSLDVHRQSNPIQIFRQTQAVYVIIHFSAPILSSRTCCHLPCAALFCVLHHPHLMPQHLSF